MAKAKVKKVTIKKALKPKAFKMKRGKVKKFGKTTKAYKTISNLRKGNGAR